MPITSNNRLLTTIAYQLGGKRTYALEGAIFIAGAAVQWLRDALRVIGTAPDVNALAAAADPAEQVYLVPAFVGLGAPWWDAQARGAVFGLTRNAGVAELARATLEAVGYQTRDLLEAMRADWPAAADTVLRVDGGMTASDITMQFLSDILAAPVDRPVVMETTALGAAYLAGLAAGLCPDLAGFAATWRRERRFMPAMDETTRERKWAGWRDAVERTRTNA
jgi:glycerol kinase